MILGHNTMSDCYFFFFKDTATTEIYTLSLHDALPIYPWPQRRGRPGRPRSRQAACARDRSEEHTSELQSHHDLVCRLLLEKKKQPPTIKRIRQTKSREETPEASPYRSAPTPRHRAGNSPARRHRASLRSFFFNDTATTEIYTLSLHDALPIRTAAPRSPRGRRCRGGSHRPAGWS